MLCYWQTKLYHKEDTVSPSPTACLRLTAPLLVCYCMFTNVWRVLLYAWCMVCGAVQLYDGLKSEMRQAMNNYNTTNKKKAIPVDGIQAAVCFSLSLSLSLSLIVSACACRRVCIADPVLFLVCLVVSVSVAGEWRPIRDYRFRLFSKLQIAILL